MKTLTVSALALLTALTMGITIGAQEKTEPLQSKTINDPTRVLASELIGEEVEKDGIEVGEIFDVVLRPACTSVCFALVENAEDGRTHAVPLSAMTIHSQNRTVVVTMPNSTLAQWPSLSDSEIEQVVTAAFAKSVAKGLDRPCRWQTSVTDGELVRASRLIDAGVIGSNDANVGELEDIAINAKRSRVPFLIVSSGGFLGFDEKHHALLPNRIEFSDPKNIKIFMTEKELSSKDAFDPDTLEGTFANKRTHDNTEANIEPQSVWVQSAWTKFDTVKWNRPMANLVPTHLPIKFAIGDTFNYKVSADIVSQADGRTKRARHANYALKVDEIDAQGAATLSVTVDWKGAWRKSKSLDNDYRVELDQLGEIKSITAMDAKATPTPGTDAYWGMRRRFPAKKSRIREHLDLILGSGLHNGSLQPGATRVRILGSKRAHLRFAYDGIKDECACFVVKSSEDNSDLRSNPKDWRKPQKKEIDETAVNITRSRTANLSTPWFGQASYSIEDGMLDRLSSECVRLGVARRLSIARQIDSEK